jgi:hypothetical protein
MESLEQVREKARSHERNGAKLLAIWAYWDADTGSSYWDICGIYEVPSSTNQRLYSAETWPHWSNRFGERKFAELGLTWLPSNLYDDVPEHRREVETLGHWLSAQLEVPFLMEPKDQVWKASMGGNPSWWDAPDSPFRPNPDDSDFE